MRLQRLTRPETWKPSFGNLGTQESCVYTFSPKVGGPKTREEPMFQSGSRGRNKKSPDRWQSERKDSFLTPRSIKSFILLWSSTDWMWWPTHFGKAICTTQSIHLNVKLIQKHPHRNPQDKISGPNIWVLSDKVKLAHERSRVCVTETSMAQTAGLLLVSSRGAVCPIDQYQVCR